MLKFLGEIAYFLFMILAIMFIASMLSLVFNPPSFQEMVDYNMLHHNVDRIGWVMNHGRLTFHEIFN